MNRLYLRLDSASFLGYGHMYQCLALAEVCRTDFSIIFLVKDHEPGVAEQIRLAGYPVLNVPHAMDEEQEVEFILSNVPREGTAGILIDHHYLSEDYSRRLKQGGYWLAQIDDEGKRGFCCDLLINYNIYADEIPYSTGTHTVKLLGPQYAILRWEFGGLPDTAKNSARLLVTMGGGYARGEVVKILAALELIAPDILERIDPVIIVGSGYPGSGELVRACADKPFTVIVSPSGMARHMMGAGFAVSGAGGTLYELARCRVPAITITLDHNQEQIADGFAARGLSVSLGWYESVTPEAIAAAITRWADQDEVREDYRRRVTGLIDGKGTERIAMEIKRQCLVA